MIMMNVDEFMKRLE